MTRLPAVIDQTAANVVPSEAASDAILVERWLSPREGHHTRRNYAHRAADFLSFVGVSCGAACKIDPLHLIMRSAAVWVPDGGYRNAGLIIHRLFDDPEFIRRSPVATTAAIRDDLNLSHKHVPRHMPKPPWLCLSVRFKRGPVQGMGRSRGGLSTKIHAATEALGLPLRLIGTPGQRNDIALAHELIAGTNAGATLADKGYDADHLVDRIEQSGAGVVIPPRRNRTARRSYDLDLYKERNRIERFFSKLKQFRRVATRYDKLLANFMGFVKLAAIAIWLK